MHVTMLLVFLVMFRLCVARFFFHILSFFYEFPFGALSHSIAFLFVSVIVCSKETAKFNYIFTRFDTYTYILARELEEVSEWGNLNLVRYIAKGLVAAIKYSLSVQKK